MDNNINIRYKIPSQKIPLLYRFYKKFAVKFPRRRISRSLTCILLQNIITLND